MNTIRELPTFAQKDYHRPWEISLPSSVWNRVEHSQYSSLIVLIIHPVKLLRTRFAGFNRVKRSLTFGLAKSEGLKFFLR